MVVVVAGGLFYYSLTAPPPGCAVRFGCTAKLSISLKKAVCVGAILQISATVRAAAHPGAVHYVCAYHVPEGAAATFRVRCKDPRVSLMAPANCLRFKAPRPRETARARSISRRACAPRLPGRQPAGGAPTCTRWRGCRWRGCIPTSVASDVAVDERHWVCPTKGAAGELRDSATVAV